MPSGKGGSASQITGYRYSMAVQFGLGRGPQNEVTEIRVGDLPAWSGSLTASGYFQITQPNLFGGDEKEGGIDGNAKLMMGEPTQTIDTVIRDNIEGNLPVPGWRGVVSVFYYGLIASNNPYPKTWKFRVNRTTAGWDTPVWEPDLATIIMQSSPQLIVSFNAQPHSGDSLFIGDTEIIFFTLTTGPPPTNVQIGADIVATAQAFATMCNANTATLFGVNASANGQFVTLTFPAATQVTQGHGVFASVSSQGGAIKAMNPAHIIYECATNSVWGRGLSPSLIDADSFKACATKLVDEGFGLCLRWNRQEDIDKFVKTIVDHVGAAVFIDRQTGLLTMKLIRDDYDPAALPAYTYQNGILDITEDSSSSSDTSYNEITVAFIDPVSGKRGTMRSHNLASFQALGTVISTTVEYLGAPTAALAARLAQRDLQMNTGDLRRLKITMDRVGWYISPADVFKISIPSRGIDSMIVRAGQIEDGPIEDETIIITAVQDVFSLPDTAFTTPQPSYWTPPDKTPRPVEQRFVGELTYYDMAENLPAGEVSSLNPDNGIVKVFAEQPTGATVDYFVSSKTTAETDYVDRTVAGFDAGATLQGDLALHGTAITFEGLSAASLITDTDIPVLIVDATDPTIQEYCRLASINKVTGAATLGRGTIDTVPHPFASGARLWFQTHMPTSDFRNLSASETAQVRLLPRTSSAVLDPALAEIDTVDIGGRQGRPYPPGNLQVAGVPFEASQTIDGVFTISWAHRDRITQANFLLDHTAASTGPEPGTTYTVEVWDGTADILEGTYDNISGTSFDFTAGVDSSTGSLEVIRFRVYSERDGLNSWQAYDFVVRRTTGFDEDFDFNFDGGA